MTPPKWEELPQQLQLEYLLGGKIKQEDWYINNAGGDTKTWTPAGFESLRQKVRNREVHYYGETDKWLYEALDLCPISGINVAIMGSTEPWYETIVMEFGGRPTTIDYNPPGYNHPGIEEISIQDYWKNPDNLMWQFLYPLSSMTDLAVTETHLTQAETYELWER